MGEGLQRAARAARRTRYPGTPEPAIGQVWVSVTNPAREVTIKCFGTVRRHGVDKRAATCTVTVGGKPRQGTAIDCDLLVPTAKGYRYLRPMGATGLTCADRGGPVTLWLGTPPPGWKPGLRPPCLACGAGCANDCAGAELHEGPANDGAVCDGASKPAGRPTERDRVLAALLAKCERSPGVTAHRRANGTRITNAQMAELLRAGDPDADAFVDAVYGAALRVLGVAAKRAAS